jgi:murein DD-endopeptidase MepM/ murein hydrolase activator NlpD
MIIFGLLFSCTKEELQIKHEPVTPLGTSPIKGIYHKVEKGQTLWRICKTYGVDIREVAEINNITDIKKIHTGQLIFIPNVEKPLEVKPFFKEEEDVKESEIVKIKDRFIWPVKGEITSYFGIREGKKHNGIDISASPGEIVVAADSGRVIFRDHLGSYGKVLIIRHDEEFATVYAHLNEWLVQIGQVVKRGEPIGKVGNTGRSSGSHLHFEIRQKNIARNPLFYLAPQHR